MARRQLTRQQTWRIEKIQEEKRQRLQRSEANIPQDSLGPERPGLVVGHFGHRLEIESIPPEQRVPCRFRSNLGAVVTGDKVVWRESPHGEGVVEAVLPRATLLARQDIRGAPKLVAANIDFMVLVITPEPAPSAVLIDRYLAAAALQEIPVKLLLNKTDLLQPDNRERVRVLLEGYENIGYQVIQASCHTRHGLDALIHELAGQVCVFVGQSGVGKSSLVNALLPGTNLRVGELSEASQLGQHTTTNARLFHLPCGGSLIDSPGIREFGLWHLNAEQLIQGFVEFLPWLEQCRFRDCRHQREPGCALLAAVERGDVARSRLENYFIILNELRG
jgi:ribosome biogenesis GTPase